jgi:integrase
VSSVLCTLLGRWFRRVFHRAIEDWLPQIQRERNLANKAIGHVKKLALLLAPVCGLRCSEVLGLKWGDIKPDQQLINVPLKYGGGGQDRTADLRVMKTPASNTSNYLHNAGNRLNTRKYV